jgi:hypothetical protein
MAQATNVSTTSASCFHNHAGPANVTVERPMFPSTRRAFIQAIAALPIAAAAPAATAHTLDADLVALGDRFEPLLDQYYAARKRWAPLMVAAHAGYDRAAAERHYQYSAEALEDSCERSGANESRDALAAISQEMEELANAINVAPVNSIAGLRAKAMVALWKLAPLRAQDTEFSFENDYRFEQLFTAVAELCGLKEKVMATGYQLPDLAIDDNFHWSEPAGQV